tara:strand:- start:6178 stop:7827 length:1650 start_codon:yes stop_codon:yes gene_type:complete
MNDNVIESVRRSSNIEELFGDYAKVKRQNGEVFVVCPFHAEKTPSLHVEPSRGVFYCHGCGASGDIFTIPMKLEGLGFIDAVQYVADRFNIEIDSDLDDSAHAIREEMKKALNVAQHHFSHAVSNPDAAAYLAERKVSKASIERWEIGYCPSSSDGIVQALRNHNLVDAAVSAGILRVSFGSPSCVFVNRIIFPIRNKIGQLVSFAGRDISGNAKAKYINGKETTLYSKSSILFGLSKAISSIRDWNRIILVEGYFDVIALHQAEVTEAVASCGTALTKDHVKLFSKLTDKALCFFDSDDAGRRAASKALPILAKSDIDSLMVNLPEGMDPADYATSNSLEDLLERIEDAEPLLATWLHSLSRTHDKTPHGRQAAANEAVPVIRSYPLIARDVVLRQVADILSVPYLALKRLVGNPAPTEVETSQSKPHDPLALALAGILMRNEDMVSDAKKLINLDWIYGAEERDAIEKILSGEPAYTVARKAAEELQPKLHRSAMGAGHEDPEKSLGKIVSRIEMRHLSRELPKQEGADRLVMQKRRLELQRRLAIR